MKVSSSFSKDWKSDGRIWYLPIRLYDLQRLWNSQNRDSHRTQQKQHFVIVSPCRCVTAPVYYRFRFRCIKYLNVLDAGEAPSQPASDKLKSLIGASPLTTINAVVKQPVNLVSTRTPIFMKRSLRKFAGCFSHKVRSRCLMAIAAYSGRYWLV